MSTPPQISIRLIEKYDEYIAVAELQKEVWGHESIEIVPPSILMVNQKIGGIVAGAFTPEGELAAFVYGLPGFREGKEVHWSHMLAVKPAWRGRGLGWLLKQYQRDFVIARNIDIIYWTFDPLESVNAILNLSKLGAFPTEYVCDLYGEGEKSMLHEGIGTDRFILKWYLTEEARVAHLARYYSAGDPQAVITEALAFEPTEEDAMAVKIEIPANIQQVKKKSPDTAWAWRSATREAFLHYYSREYGVVSFVKDHGAKNTDSNRYFYVMSKQR